MKNRTLAILGNPNSGKTTLFNQLTGANQQVGNWPGVTVEQKIGQFRWQEVGMELVDLPGIYSLSPYTQEEIIAREYVLSDVPDGIVNIVDATNLERGLYLTLQLIGLGLPMLVVLGFMDELHAQKIEIDADRLAACLGVPVVAISARRGQGLNRLREMMASGMQPPDRQPAYLRGVGAAIRSVQQLLTPITLRRQSLPFYAAKLLEGDVAMQDCVNNHPALSAKIQSVAAALCRQCNTEDAAMALAQARYAYIAQLLHTVRQASASQKHSVTDAIDKLLLHRALALPIFAGWMALMFWCTFGAPGAMLKQGMEQLLQQTVPPAADAVMTVIRAAPWLRQLVCDGILAGVGGVLGFLPQMLILFFFLSLLEDTGYLARIAFMMDAVLRPIGLSGKALVPMLMGFGCTTTAVMAARTMESQRDRRMTILLTPWMSCGAKLPVYALVAGAVFDQYAGLVVVSLYLIGVVTSVFVGFALKKTIFPQNCAGFVLELPSYRLPSLTGTLRNVWRRAEDFFMRAGTIILFMSAAIWALQYFTPTLTIAQSGEQSILAVIGTAMAPLFQPLGFDGWEPTVALLTGLVAKEAVVSTMGVLYGTGGDAAALSTRLSGVFSPCSAYSFLVFTLLYMPCVSAIAAMKRELGGWRWVVAAATFQTALAYAAAFLAYRIGLLLG